MTPSWYVEPTEQIRKVGDFLALYSGGNGFRCTDIPDIPDRFELVGNDVFLLTVSLPNSGGISSSFDAWWKFITLPQGYTTWRWEELTADRLLLESGHGYEPGIHWVAFNPSAHQGLSPAEAFVASEKSDAKLARIEVLTAAAMFPEWPLSWNGSSSPYPQLSGFRFLWKQNGPQCVPYLSFRSDYQLALWARRADALPNWASPTVRRC